MRTRQDEERDEWSWIKTAIARQTAATPGRNARVRRLTAMGRGAIASDPPFRRRRGRRRHRRPSSSPPPARCSRVDRTGEGLPGFAFSVCSPRPGPVPLLGGVRHHRPAPARAPADGRPRGRAGARHRAPARPCARARRCRRRRAGGATVVSLCSGAFTLGGPACSTAAGPPRTGIYAADFAARFPLVDVAPMCSSSRTARLPRAPARRPASTCACTSSGASTGRRSPTSPGGWSCHRSGTAARRSSSRRRCGRPTCRRWRRCSTGSSPTSTRAVRRRPRPPGAHGGAHVRPPLPRRDRHDAAPLAACAARRAGGTVARGGRPADRGRRAPVRLRFGRDAAAPLQAAAVDRPARFPPRLRSPRRGELQPEAEQVDPGAGDQSSSGLRVKPRVV